MLRDRAACSASNTTAAGSEPWPWRMTGTPRRSPHTTSCSIAAARKVSAATSATLSPRSTERRAIFAIDVVLPDPLTPITSVTSREVTGTLAIGGASSEQHRDLVDQELAQAPRVDQLVRAESHAHPLDQLERGLDADVGGDEGLLERGQHLLAAPTPRSSTTAVMRSTIWSRVFANPWRSRFHRLDSSTMSGRGK